MGTDSSEPASHGARAGETLPQTGEAPPPPPPVASTAPPPPPPSGTRPAETWVVEAQLLGREVYLTNGDPRRPDAWVDDLEEVTLALDSADEARTWLERVRAVHGPDSLIQAPTIRRVDVGGELATDGQLLALQTPLPDE